MTNILRLTIEEIHNSLKHGSHNQLDHNPHKRGGNLSQKAKSLMDKPKSDYKVYKRNDDIRNEYLQIIDTRVNDQFSSNEEYLSWRENLNRDEIYAIKSYIGENYKAINESLRRWGRDADKYGFGETIDTLNQAISKNKISEDLMVYRGMSADVGWPIHKELSSLQEGDVWEDKGFISTSLNNPRFGAIQFEIRIPKDTIGAFIGFEDLDSETYLENEILLLSSSKFLIHNVRKTSYQGKPDAGLIVEATILPQDE